MELTFGAEYWSGVESDSGVAKVEWSAVVCVCVCACVRAGLYSIEYTRCRVDDSRHLAQLYAHFNYIFSYMQYISLSQGEGGMQWLSDRVLDSRPRGRGFEPHRRHCIVSLS